MKFLFNVAGVASEIFVGEDGRPVLATHISNSFEKVADVNGQPIPDDGVLVGQICDTGDHQLTKQDKLTLAGVGYCSIMGVERSADALRRFVTLSKRTQVAAEFMHKHAEPA